MGKGRWHTPIELPDDPTSDFEAATKRYVDNSANDKASLNSPAFTGSPSAPTPATLVNDTQIATTAYVVARIANDAPSKAGTGASGTWGIAITGNAATANALTVARNFSLTGVITATAVAFNGTDNVVLATAIADDALSIAKVAGLQTALDGKASLSGATYIGDILLPGDPTLPLHAATKAYVDAQVAAGGGSSGAPLDSPAFTGTPTAPTAPTATNTTQLATTAFVVSRIAQDAPTKAGDGATGTWGISISGNAATATSAATAAQLTTSRAISLTGIITAPGVNFNGTSAISLSTSIADNALSIAKTNGLQAALDNKASLADPVFTGTPTAPTPLMSDNSTRLATTSYVVNRIANDAPTKTGTGANGTWGISVTGSAATLATARNFSLTGIVTATAVGFDGSGNVSLTTAIADNALSIAKTSGLQAALDGKSNSGHQHVTNDIGQLDAMVRAEVESMLQQGTNVTITGSGVGAARMLTIAASGGGGSSSPVVEYVAMTSDVSMPSSNVWYTAVTMNLPKGIWLVFAKANTARTQTTLANYACRLWDGTNIFDGANDSSPSQNPHYKNFQLFALITNPDISTLPISIQCATSAGHNNSKIVATAAYGAMPNVTNILAIKLADAGLPEM